MQLHKIRRLAAKIPRERRKGAWKKWLVMIPIMLMASGLIYFVNLPQYQIETIEIEGALLTSRSDVHDIVTQELGRRYMFLVPKTFMWLFPRISIRNKIETIPSVLDVSLDLKHKERKLLITIEDRKHEYVWCSKTSPEKCFYMDRAGLVFAESPKFEGSAFLRFYGQIDEAEPINKIYLDSARMIDLTEFLKNIEMLGLRSAEVRVNSIREVHVVLLSGTDLIVSMEKPLDAVAGNLRTILNSPEFKKEVRNVDDISYMDLRYGNKAYWKQK